ncbi:hypothetical protein BD310DRAFT_982704 [Dichomitus squalens]|uniref:Uncharacterized protein n=1 Tax=Dichomitus squalens TaxID=114155 RepID=A0A4Q9P9J8_9APHY|nr:hypothetical protein BD310DRAFT_982704 [Dichomitus squalens]
MLTDQAKKLKKVKIHDNRKPPPVSAPTAKPPRGNQAKAIVPLPGTPPGQKCPPTPHDDGPRKKKLKPAQDTPSSSDTQGADTVPRTRGNPDLQQAPLNAPTASHCLPRRAKHAWAPHSSSTPPDSSSSATASSHTDSSSYQYTLDSADAIAETIRRMKAKDAQRRAAAEGRHIPKEDAPSMKQQGRTEPLESEEESEESEEEDDPPGGEGPSQEDDNNDGEEVSSADARRLIKAIRKSKKNKFQISPHDADPKNSTEHFKTWGRHCHRLCGLYTDIHKTIVCGLTVMRADPSSEEEYERCYKAVPNMSAATAKFYTDKFFHLCDHIPKFMALCEQILLSPEDVFLFAKFMQVHAAAGRTTDISTLKASFHSYFPYVVISKDLVIPPPGPGQLAGLKTRNGGYCNTSTGRLIVPIDERSAFDRDPAQYCKKKIAHHKEVTNTVRHKKRHQADRPEPRNNNKSYPSFLFPTDLKYDNTCPQRHIIKSDFLIASYRHLFHGRSVVGRADGSRGLGRVCINDIYGITNVTPDYLAYVASLIRHLLSTEERWSGDDRQRTGHHFHTALHRLLTVEYQAWQEDVENGDFRQSDDPMDWNVFAYVNECVIALMDQWYFS